MTDFPDEVKQQNGNAVGRPLRQNKTGTGDSPRRTSQLITSGPVEQSPILRKSVDRR